MLLRIAPGADALLGGDKQAIVGIQEEIPCNVVHVNGIVRPVLLGKELLNELKGLHRSENHL